MIASGKVVVGARVRRHKLNNFFESGHGCVEPARAMQHDAEVQMRVRKVRLEGYGMRIFGQAVFKATLLRKSVSQIEINIR